jgi:hypothetical protein
MWCGMDRPLASQRIGAAKCETLVLAGAIVDGVIDLLDAADTNQPPDYAQIGSDLLRRYGPDAGVCAVRVAWQHLVAAQEANSGTSPPSGASSSIATAPDSRLARRLAALEWLVHNEDRWTKILSGT